jgi:hypothetical protein
MPLLINNRVINFGGMSKEVTFLKEKVQWLKDNLTEDGKNLILVWNDTKEKVSTFRKVIKGFSQNRLSTPQGYLITMSALVPLFKDEGLVEIMYLRRPPAQEGGFAIDPKRDKEIFTGRMTINIDRQPDLAFFMYYCCPQCAGGPNSDNTNVFKVLHNEKEAAKKNEAIRSKVATERYALAQENQGGLNEGEIRVIAASILGITAKMGIEQLRQKVYMRCLENEKYRNQFIKASEDALKARIQLPPTPKKVEIPVQAVVVEEDPDLPDDVAYPELQDDFDELEALVEEFSEENPQLGKLEEDKLPATAPEGKSVTDGLNIVPAKPQSLIKRQAKAKTKAKPKGRKPVKK